MIRLPEAHFVIAILRKLADRKKYFYFIRECINGNDLRIDYQLIVEPPVDYLLLQPTS